MKFNFARTAAPVAVALALSLAACDSPEEEAMEDQAEMMEDNRDETVNEMEAEGMITDDTADQMDDQTDAMEENMEDQADEM
ncbi:MAG: hypothetical protein WA985_07750 [Erythrobacter sp.]|uniref:hypothetical protein n=1 Tax=Erythrobacter sp. TaxID=1042 RepID=UPI003C755A7E